ncbi:MAG: hypothetical protein DI534_05745 [Leifsonia xyli]|nr:MAG: hypothetical protein DI534_05745 [Leifsonia xyli]
MSDLWRELPLFGRPRVDESSLSDGWEADLAAVREAASAALARHPDDAAAAAFAAATPPPPPRRDGRPRPVKLAELDRAVYAYLELCARLELEPEVPARAGGAVALARAASAPTAIRAVIAGHSLRATDADWSFGRGPVLEDTAAALLAFLGGRSLRAPHPGSPPQP